MKTNVKKLLAGVSAAAGAAMAVSELMRKKAQKTTYVADAMPPIKQRNKGFYEEYVKRGLDVACAVGAITVFSPVYLVVAVLVRMKLGSPVLFTQDRPGLINDDGKETVFKMYKFRTMTDARDENGQLLPDEQRLTAFGKMLRSTSLDELPEAINILNGTMSVIGPRPQLVRDLVFMSKEQRYRHTAKPGMSGLAQINGRNAIKWEDKIDWDIEYVDKISFLTDLKIVLDTVKKVFGREEKDEELNVALDFGDELLTSGIITHDEYEKLQMLARNITGAKACEYSNLHMKG